MGLQQLFLIVLSMMIIAIMVGGAILLFNERARDANRRAIIQDMYNIATIAVTFSKTPVSQGGGGGEWDVDDFMMFCGYPISRNGRFIETDNGRIRVTVNARYRLIVRGWGNELGFDSENEIRGRLVLRGTTAEEMIFRILN